MKYSLLDGIKSPSDIRKLNKSEISLLSDEIRDFLIENDIPDLYRIGLI
jgi:deoxyxylulose-5-phosphate synthase